MADYLTKFSFIVPLPDQAAQTYALRLAEQASLGAETDESADELPRSLARVVDDWYLETKPETAPGKWGLWLSSTVGSLNAVCAFVQYLLRKFQPAGRVAFEWSHDCTKPRLDAYGGGAAVITARKIKTMTTFDWLQKQEARRGKLNNQPKEET
jgi:hypothetical protein